MVLDCKNGAKNEENKNDFSLLAIDDKPLAFASDDFKFEGKGNRHML